MIIKQVTLTNFGLYGGDEWLFDLTPQPQDGFNRPILLFKGKNGSGKTTLSEAIRLCLHGSLVLGSRVSQAEYEAYLAQLIHAPASHQRKPTSAKVGLVLEYVSVGCKHTYHLERRWHRTKNGVKEDLDILEDGNPLPELSTLQEKESFLRELVPPHVADVFFFDGERLQLLAGDETSHYLLADTIKTLLGLHLVEQLQKDLDLYLARQETNSGLKTLQKQLAILTQEKSDLEQERLALEDEKKANQVAISRVGTQIRRQEQKIDQQGSWFAERLDDLKATQQRLETEIELQRKKAQELANGLLPFAVAPHMANLVARRLQQEKVYEQAVSAQQIITACYEHVEADMKRPHSLAELGIEVDEDKLAKLLARIETTMKQKAQDPPLDSDEVILRVSEPERQTLSMWIAQALDEVPRQFCQTISRLNALEDEQARVEYELTLVPSDEMLKPLVETLHVYNQELGALRQIEQDLNQQLDHLDHQLDQITYQLRAVRQQISEQQQHNQRIQLATQTQRVLEDYAQALHREKIATLERVLTQRFNELSRKTDLVEAVKIGPATFKMTLFRQRQPFEREQLSAGEKQILAVATIWALREVSGVPMPIVLDAPLGRLDSDHRLKMIEDYFPRASHQVILLTTDTEIDAQMEAKLKPVISRCYTLSDNLAQTN
jgi:DNA sulfur modification protein DndD